MVEHLVGYAKQDLIVPQQPFDDLETANRAAAAWCTEVNNATHSEISAVPAERLAAEKPLLAGLPSLRLQLGCPAGQPEGRQVVVCPARLGPLLGTMPVDRPACHDHQHHDNDHDH